MGSEIQKHDHLKYGQMTSIFTKKPFEIRPSKSQISHGQISDPHFIWFKNFLQHKFYTNEMFIKMLPEANPINIFTP